MPAMSDRPGARAGVKASPAAGPEQVAGTDALVQTRRDEDAAAEARLRYRREPMQPIEEDATIAPLLWPGERLLSVRHGAILDRRHGRAGCRDTGLLGDLYLTSARLIHIGRLMLAFRLDKVDEAVLSGDTLLLVLAEGVGISLVVDAPRLLRVEIATARAAARS